MQKLSCKGYVFNRIPLSVLLFSQTTPFTAPPTNVSAVFSALFFLPSLSPFQAVKVSTPTICLKDIQGSARERESNRVLKRLELPRRHDYKSEYIIWPSSTETGKEISFRFSPLFFISPNYYCSCLGGEGNDFLLRNLSCFSFFPSLSS